MKEPAQPEKDGSAGTNQSGDAQNDATPSPSAVPTVIATPIPEPSKYPCVGNTASGTCTPAVPDKINNPYSVAEPVPADARSGSISLIFKDEFKVRYNKEQNKFISLLGYDTSNINKLMNEYKPIKIYGDVGIISEEEAEQREKRLEASDGYDYPNQLSSYSLKVENINIKEFVEKLRADNLVRESNYDFGGVPD